MRNPEYPPGQPRPEEEGETLFKQIEEEWQPEEDKEWPEYIKRRFKALNYVHNLDIDGLDKLLEEYPSLKHPSLYFYLVGRINEPRKTEEINPQITDRTLEMIYPLARDKNSDVRYTATTILGNLGEIAPKPAKELIRDENPDVREAAATALTNIKKGSKGIPSLQFIKSLIVRQEPFLANPLVEDIYYPEKEKESPILKLNDIVNNLREKYPFLIGLSVLGSFSKGYWTPKSDLDWGLVFNPENQTEIGKIKEIKQEFEEEAGKEGFHLCADHSVNIASINTQTPPELEILFNGLFLGERKALREAQFQVVNSIDEEKWRTIQEEWNTALQGYSKMIERFDLTTKEVNRIKNLRQFLWSLPDYKTVRQEFSNKIN